jgi:hypothetical protein
MAIKPSPIFAALLLFMHTTAFIVVYLTAIPLPATLALFLLIALSLIYHLARDVLLLLPNSWYEVTLVPGGLSVAVRDGPGFFAQLENKTTVSPYFVVLRVRLEGHRLLVTRIIFPDALDAGAFRELCVQLKFSRLD